MIDNKNSSKEFKDRIQYRSTDLEYYIKRSKRIKTSELIVDSNRIEIRTPINKTLKDTRSIVLDKADWILRKQKQYEETIPEIMIPTFVDNSTLPYLGRNYSLKIKKNQSTNTMRFVDGKFVVYIIATDLNKEIRSQIRGLYEDWLKRSAQKNFKRRVEIYAQEVGVNIQKVSVKNNLKSRWASVTKNGSIHFNIHLIKAPQDVVDYIVLHEICHRRIRGHSHRYWGLLYRYMPNYQEKINWLNLNGRSILENIM
jgi:predicted metal-dependent hydrolase